jgi:hypothetical protein
MDREVIGMFWRLRIITLSHHYLARHDMSDQADCAQ